MQALEIILVMRKEMLNRPIEEQASMKKDLQRKMRKIKTDSLCFQWCWSLSGTLPLRFGKCWNKSKYNSNKIVTRSSIFYSVVAMDSGN